ncbi:hypothetical protein TRVL_05961 [Trypanosoma vivax]|nr:hypothetical protein TRVL_05961 [Trypanosoma vivax]
MGARNWNQNITLTRRWRNTVPFFFQNSASALSMMGSIRGEPPPQQHVYPATTSLISNEWFGGSRFQTLQKKTFKLWCADRKGREKRRCLPSHYIVSKAWDRSLFLRSTSDLGREQKWHRNNCARAQVAHVPTCIKK